MHFINYHDNYQPNYSYSKLMPAPISFYNQDYIYFNVDYSTKTSAFDGISINSILFYEAFSSFANCEIVDYFTMQCLKCTNDKNPKIQCNDCPAQQFFNSTAIECQCNPGYWYYFRNEK